MFVLLVSSHVCHHFLSQLLPALAQGAIVILDVVCGNLLSAGLCPQHLKTPLSTAQWITWSTEPHLHCLSVYRALPSFPSSQGKMSQSAVQRQAVAGASQLTKKLAFLEVHVHYLCGGQSPDRSECLCTGSGLLLSSRGPYRVRMFPLCLSHRATGFFN